MGFVKDAANPTMNAPAKKGKVRAGSAEPGDYRAQL